MSLKVGPAKTARCRGADLPSRSDVNGGGNSCAPIRQMGDRLPRRSSADVEAVCDGPTTGYFIIKEKKARRGDAAAGCLVKAR